VGLLSHKIFISINELSQILKKIAMVLGERKNYLNEFGKNLKKIRMKKKLSLRKLDANCNIDHSDIAKIEKGEVNITLLTIFDLAKGLEVNPKKLLDFESDFGDE
jgi:DNA-binding Xre family transcriptional regulator